MEQVESKFCRFSLYVNNKFGKSALREVLFRAGLTYSCDDELH